MCGFANTQGGMIIVGVNAKKVIIGIKEDIDELQQKISASAQAVSPPLVPVKPAPEAVVPGGAAAPVEV